MTNKRKVLVVDTSRVVRASLIKQLASRFEVREEADEESAWQTMVLDSAIVAVVSGLPLDRDDERGLLERLRASKLSRLKNVPFFLVISNSYPDAERQEARKFGVSEFIIKGSDSPSIESIVAARMEWREDAADGRLQATSPIVGEDLGQFGVQSDVGFSNIMGQIAGLEPSGDDEPADDGDSNEDALLAQEMLEEYLAERLPEVLEGHGMGVLAFGLDGYDGLVVRYGAELAFSSAQKFCYLLSRKIRPEDFIGQLANGRVVIVSASSSAAACAGFASRICKAMAGAQISLHGERINLTVSVGVAVVPDDGAEFSAGDLLQLAYERLDAAFGAGGNRVVLRSSQPDSGLGSCESFVPRLKELLSTTDPAVLLPCLATVGVQLMPILRELEKNFRLGLPIEEMHKRLSDRARAERMAISTSIESE